MKYLFPIALVVVIAILGGVYFLKNAGTTEPAPASGTTSAPHETTNPQAASGGETVTTGGTPTSYTSAQVASHAGAASCWTSIGGKVYDLTSWINRHPGGREAILSLCGHDGTDAFDRQHGGQARPEQELATFYIGTLSE